MFLWALLSAAFAFASLARVALVATAVQLGTWLWLNGRRKSIGLVLGAMVLGCILTPSVREVVEQAVRPFREGRYYELGTGRGLLFAAQARAFLGGSALQKVAGHGLHSSPALTIEYNPIPLMDLGGPESVEGQLSAHNQFLRPLVESGIVGAIALTSILFIGVTSAIRLLGALRGSFDREFGIAVLTMIAGFAIYSISSQPLDRPPVTWPVFTVIGFAFSLSRRARHCRSEVRIPPD
jgi:hypothetical protein